MLVAFYLFVSLVISKINGHLVLNMAFNSCCMLSVVIFLISSSFSVSRAEIIITNVDRTIDLTSQIAKISSAISLENTGKSPVKDVVIAVDQSSQLSYLEVSEKSEDTNLEVSPTTKPGKSGAFYLVKLASPLASKKTVSIDVEMVFTHILKPFPEKIGQSDKQLVLYLGNTVLYSPYVVKQQKTTVKLSSSTIESYSRLKPSSSSESTITYGPYKDSKAYRTHEMRVHFENNSPFLSVNDMTRWIEVSHWGNIAVEETCHVTHTGAQLKGHFSRYDYQRTPTHAAIKQFKSVLPASAKDVYYRDEIGNISTSNMLAQDDSVELVLRPRFPLFGGWQTRYYMGYNVPTYQYLYVKGNEYVLKMRLVDHVFDDFIVDKLNVKVVLPEGATNVRIQTPYPITEGEMENHKTYLDTVGRPVVTFKKDNVVENHIQDFEIRYTFKKVQLLQEPMLCVAAFYILFITVILFVRLDFSITKDAAKESRMKVASLIEELLTACERRTGLYATFDAAVDKFKQSRDQTAFATAQKKQHQDYSALTQSINELCASLVKEDSELGEKLAELQKKENDRKLIMDQLVNLATKVVSNKLGRQQYVDAEQTTQAKKEKISEEIDSLLTAL